MWKLLLPSPSYKNPSAIILYTRVCTDRSVLRPAPTHCQGAGQKPAYRPALWHSLCTLNSYCNSLRWVREVRRLAAVSKRGLPETLTFCFGHERRCLCLTKRGFLSAVWSVLRFCMSAPKLMSNQANVGWERVLYYWRWCYELHPETSLCPCAYIDCWTLPSFPESCKSIIAFFFSFKNLFHRTSSTKADLKWLEANGSCIH